MWHALSIFRTWLLPLLPAGSPWGCLPSIPACRFSLPDWTPLINCQLDWLQVFIICDDRADLEANLNQGCWGTGQQEVLCAGLLFSVWCTDFRRSHGPLENIRFLCMQHLTVKKSTKGMFSPAIHNSWSPQLFRLCVGVRSHLHDSVVLLLIFVEDYGENSCEKWASG